MGRKSSAKLQRSGEGSGAGQGSSAAPPSKRNVIFGAVAVFVAVIGAYAYVANGRTNGAAGTAAADQPQPLPVSDARWAKFGPHKQATLPPLPVQAFAPPRPINVVHAAYQFAAEHPEILEYVPCFCGCERGGHKGNHDCFVAARNEKGDVTEWDSHGLDCAVCIDVATEAARMHASGAGVRDIRAAIEQKWAGFHGGHTPTPNPPRGE